MAEKIPFAAFAIVEDSDNPAYKFIVRFPNETKVYLNTDAEVQVCIQAHSGTGKVGIHSLSSQSIKFIPRIKVDSPELVRAWQEGKKARISAHFSSS